MNGNTRSVADLLYRLEQELSRLGLWSETPPDATALASQQPFCHDTMPFHTWLQWVFIPRIRQLLESGSPLPDSCAIAPMAELMCAETGVDGHALIATLQAIDACISGSPIDPDNQGS